MTSLRRLLDYVPGSDSPDGQADLALGLPLESNGRTIYPVFRDPTPADSDTAGPRQIGYLELSEGRSDFISLESDTRPLFLIPVLLALLVCVIWFARRDSR
jgi:hypothetical protein